MRAFLGHWMRWTGLMLAPALIIGCGDKGRSGRSVDALDEPGLGQTVASVAEAKRPEPVVVEGYGLVGGLSGTGSPMCPSGLRAYLKNHILSQLPSATVDLDKVIDSRNTAVVQLVGLVPAVASKGERFDVRVRPVDGSDATSLRGGWLYKADLRTHGTAQVQSRALATVEGSVFVNLVGTAEFRLTDGYILGGGTSNCDYSGSVRMRRAKYAVASAIRNRLNERYGFGTAQAVSATGIDFIIPPMYQRRKARFVSMVAATYLTDTPELVEKRVSTLVARLAAAENAEQCEIGLEAIGRSCLAQVAALLESPSEEVRWRAGRCMLNLGDDRGWEPLRAIAMDVDSPHRLEALDAIVASAQRNEAAALARRLLRDGDTRVVLAAYEHLRRMEDIAVQQEFVGGSFYIEQVVQTDRKAIFVSRSGDPRVVVFGAPVVCRDNLFVESPDERVVIDSREGQDYVSLARRVPGEEGVVGPVRSGSTVSEIVRTLAAQPRRARGRRSDPAGLGASYSDVTAVLEQLAAKEGVAAEFWAGPLPKIGLLVKK